MATMSLLAMALHATNNLPGDQIDENQNEQISPNNSLQSKDFNEMETDGAEELGKHMENLVEKNEEDDDKALMTKRSPLVWVTPFSNPHCFPESLSLPILGLLIFSTFFGPPSAFQWCWLPQAIQPMQCSMCLMSF